MEVEINKVYKFSTSHFTSCIFLSLIRVQKSHSRAFLFLMYHKSSEHLITNSKYFGNFMNAIWFRTFVPTNICNLELHRHLCSQTTKNYDFIFFVKKTPSTFPISSKLKFRTPPPHPKYILNVSFLQCFYLGHIFKFHWM